MPAQHNTDTHGGKTRLPYTLHEGSLKGSSHVRRGGTWPPLCPRQAEVIGGGDSWAWQGVTSELTPWGLYVTVNILQRPSDAFHFPSKFCLGFILAGWRVRERCQVAHCKVWAGLLLTQHLNTQGTQKSGSSLNHHLLATSSSCLPLPAHFLNHETWPGCAWGTKAACLPP